MKYCKAWIYEKKGLKNADLYFALEDMSEENVRNLYASFNWRFVRMPREISRLEYARAILFHPVTEHENCFQYKTAVVIR